MSPDKESGVPRRVGKTPSGLNTGPARPHSGQFRSEPIGGGGAGTPTVEGLRSGGESFSGIVELRSVAEGKRRAKRLHEELEALCGRLVEMTGLVRAAMAQASAALLDADLQLAEKVISDDLQVDKIRSAIEDTVFDLMARQQPVAGDLRAVVTALRMSGDLERMGDSTCDGGPGGRRGCRRDLERFPPAPEHIPDWLTLTYATSVITGADCRIGPGRPESHAGLTVPIGSVRQGSAED